VVILILVTLGTQDKPFLRLLSALQKEIDNGVINEEVIVQAGCTEFESDDMKIFDLIPTEEFSQLIKKCDLLITHGGVGCIVTALKHNKKVIGLARLKKYGEHTNDHQLQLLENFEQSGFLIHLKNENELGMAIKNIKNFKPKKYKQNNSVFIEKLVEYIDNIK